MPEIVTFASNVMTLNTGDVIACGTNHEGIGFIQHGERLTIEIEGFGPMELDVVDPLRRSWEKGIYLGEDSTNPAAVRASGKQKCHDMASRLPGLLSLSSSRARPATDCMREPKFSRRWLDVASSQAFRGSVGLDVVG